jgi:hypothetical protein
LTCRHRDVVACITGESSVLSESAGDGVLVPWLPDGLAGCRFDPGSAAELRYVIVEEMVGGTCR